MPAERIELAIPPTVEWLALARTTGAAIASRWAFTYDEIADLRLAIDELCLTLIEGPPPERIEIVYALDGDALTVEGTAVGVDSSAPAADSLTGEPAISADLSARILDALVDSHGEETAESTRRSWLRKTRSVREG